MRPMLLLTTFLLASPATLPAADPAKPNILFILADDLSIDGVSCDVTAVTVPKGTYAGDVVHEFTLDFIPRNKEKPFFPYYSMPIL